MENKVIGELAKKLDDIGNRDWVDGFIDGYWGRDSAKTGGKDYEEGYGRGYATAETQSGLVQFHSNRKEQ